MDGDTGSDNVRQARGMLSKVGLVVVVIATWWCLWTWGTSDVEIWLAWIWHLTTLGPRLGYAQIQADYPPGASVVLWCVGQVAGLWAVNPRAVLKLGLVLFLLMTTATILAASRRAGLSAFAHAALVLNAVVLMYLDILTAPFVLGAVWAASAGRPALMTSLLVAASLMKWQPLLLVPFAAVHVLRLRATAEPRTWRRGAVLSAAIPAGLVLVTVAIYGFSPVYDALDRASHHNNLSNYGANPLWVLTWFFELTATAGRQALSPDGLVTIMAASRPVIRASSLLSLVLYVMVLRKYWTSGDRTAGGFVRFSLAGYLVYFLCSVGVHENHLFLAALLGMAVAWLEPGRLWAAVVLAMAANLNLLVFYGWRGVEIDRVVGGIDVSVWLAVAISIAVTAVALRLMKVLPGAEAPGLHPS